MTACNSPSGTSRATSSVATMPPKRLARPAIRSSASAMAALPLPMRTIGQRTQQAIDAAAGEQDDHQQKRTEHDLPEFAGLRRAGGIERVHDGADRRRQELLQEQQRQR